MGLRLIKNVLKRDSQIVCWSGTPASFHRTPEFSKGLFAKFELGPHVHHPG
jgi:hypothetical protein